MQKLQGWVEQGGTSLTISGGAGTISQKVQGSFVSCTVTVYAVGTVNISTIYSDDGVTAKANPFTVSSDGSWFFYAANGDYDVRFSGTGITTPFTLGDFSLFDGPDLITNLPINVMDYMTAAQKTNIRANTATLDTTAAILAADTAAGTTGTIYIPNGTYLVGTALTFTSNVVSDGAFSGTGVIKFAANSRTEVTPEMFGCAGDGTTNDKTKFQRALDSLQNGHLIFRTDSRKSYKFGTGDGSGSFMSLWASNVTYEFGNTKFIGNMTVGNWDDTTIKPSNVIINGGIYAPTGRANNPVNRYQAENNALAITIGTKITVNNPKFELAGSTRAISVQTDTGWGVAGYQNIDGVTINDPIIYGDGDTQDAIDISSSGNYNTMIQNVQVNNPIISDTMRAVLILHSSSGYHNERIHVNNLLANNISDTAVHVESSHYCGVSGKVQNVGWRGLYSYKTNFSTIDLDIYGKNGLATPAFDITDPSYSTQVPTGVFIQSIASNPPVFYKTLSVSGYDSSNKWDVGIAPRGINAIFGDVVLRDCATGIQNDAGYQSIWNSVSFSGVTTPFSGALTTDMWFGQAVVPGNPPVNLIPLSLGALDTLEVTGTSLFHDAISVDPPSGQPGWAVIGHTVANDGAKVDLLGYHDTFKNWQIGVGAGGPGGDLYFTPSTIAGGTTYSTPILTLTSSSISISGSEQVSSAVASTLGGYYRTFLESTGTPSGTSAAFDIPVNVPSGAKILGCQLRVDTALTTGETWGAAYVTGSTTTLAVAGQAVAKNTKVNKMHVDEITTAETKVRITRDAGNFTDGVGVIRAIVYYEQFTAMGSL